MRTTDRNLTALALSFLMVIVPTFIMTWGDSKKDEVSSVSSESSTPTKPKRELRFVVERVFAGAPSSYALMHGDEGKVTIDNLTTIVEKKTGVTCDWVGFNVTFEEVAEDKPMEVIMTTNDSDPGGWGKWIWDVKILIHNPKDVHAGTWQYKKKDGRGTKTVTGKSEVIQ
jgi:hypothetical protein